MDKRWQCYGIWWKWKLMEIDLQIGLQGKLTEMWLKLLKIDGNKL